jgi:hypothetical protein
MGPIRIKECPLDNVTDLELIGSARPILSIDHQMLIVLIVLCAASQFHLVVIRIEVNIPVRSPDNALIIPVHNFHVRISI